jgi:hypothetical protein
VIRLLLLALLALPLYAGDANKVPGDGTWAAFGAPSLSGAVYFVDPSGARFPAYFYARQDNQLAGTITTGATQGGSVSFACAHVVHGDEVPSPRVLEIRKPIPVVRATVRPSGAWTAQGKDGGTCTAQIDLNIGDRSVANLPATARLWLGGARGAKGTILSIEATCTVPGKQLGAVDDQPIKIVVKTWAKPGT